MVIVFTKFMTTTIRTSVSLPKNIWQKLSSRKNRSEVISRALEVFFVREQFLKNADEKFWKEVEKSLNEKDGSYISAGKNPVELIFSKAGTKDGGK